MAIIKNGYRRDISPFNGDGGVQNFTFKGKNKNIYTYPSTHNKEFKDIGWKQLIGPDMDVHQDGIDYILDNFSTIRIHECVQETKIDSIINSIRNLVDGFKDGKETYEKAKKNGSFGLLGKWLSLAVTSNPFMESLMEGFKEFKGTALEKETALKLVYALQYCLMRRDWNATYELPYDSKQLYQTNGADGWKTIESGFGGTSSNSLIGKALNFIGSQVRMISEPIWQGTSQTSQTSINIKVNLINSDIERAVSNFHFVHNIIPGNMYLQYGLLQQAPSYYDVHIMGNRRYPICQGNFTCNASGMLRKVDLDSLKEKMPYPSPTFYSILEKLCTGSARHELRIPDVYELDLNFKSLLPDSFNDFLYFWALDESQMTPLHIDGTEILSHEKLKENFGKITNAVLSEDGQMTGKFEGSEGKSKEEITTMLQNINEDGVAGEVDQILKRKAEEPNTTKE